MTTPESPDDGLDPTLRRLTWILVLGALAPALDTSIVNVALGPAPAALRAALYSSPGRSAWCWWEASRFMPCGCVSARSST